MKNAILATIIAVSLFAAACVPSLHPIYTEQDIIFDNALIGKWVDPESKESWTFSIASPNVYRVVHRDSEGKTGEFHARLVRISGNLFLDLTPVDLSGRPAEYYRDHFQKVHSFVHIVEIGQAAKLRNLEPDWLKSVLQDNPEGIRHERIGQELLLTASTRDLQKFLVDNLGTRGAFSQPFELHRKRP